MLIRFRLQSKGKFNIACKFFCSFFIAQVQIFVISLRINMSSKKGHYISVVQKS